MICNCHNVGLDWERASLSAYLEATQAASADPKDRVVEASDDLRSFFKAHTLQ